MFSHHSPSHKARAWVKPALPSGLPMCWLRSVTRRCWRSAGLAGWDPLGPPLPVTAAWPGDHRITESQNGRGWKGPLWVIQSNPLLKQGHLQQAAQDRVQAGLEYLQRRRLHSLPGQPGPGLRHPHSEEVLPHVQLEPPLLQFVSIAPCPVTGHH